ncbi:MAG: hypothetical protein V8Q25_14495 [Roseburia faecis]
MANTRHTYHLHSKEIEEIIRNNGLPEEISTETQLWDLIIKKATYSSPKLLFPLIYEIYGKKYPEDSSVVPLSTEYSVERSDTKEISTIKADLTFCVNESDIYHFECEITYNGLITIRMFEYDVHASLNYPVRHQKSAASARIPELCRSFPAGNEKDPGLSKLSDPVSGWQYSRIPRSNRKGAVLYPRRNQRETFVYAHPVSSNPVPPPHPF